MTEKTKAIIILIAVAIAYYIFVGVIQAVSLYLLYDNGILGPVSPSNDFHLSTSYLISAFAQALFVYVLFNVIKTGKDCTNGKFNYKIDKFFYIALALGILKISHVLVFSDVHYLDSHNIADYVISELISIIVFSIITELFYRHWTITFLEKYNFQPRTICITSVIMYYVMNHIYLISIIEPNLGGIMVDALFYIASGIILYQLYTKTRDVRYCIIMQMIISATGAIITAFHSFMLPHAY
jgi:hypothetical protein